MPVVVITPSKATPKKVNNYIMQEKKTQDDLKFSAYCNPDSFAEDFKVVQNAYNRCMKRDNRKYYHIKLSWATKDEVTPQQAKEMAVRFCEESNINGCQYAGSIHTDTKTIHAHIVINNVRLEDNEYGKAGHSYQATKESREKMMEVANELAKEYGLTHSIIPEKQKAKERYSRGEVELYKKGEMPWKDKLRWDIDEAKRKAHDLNEWKEILKENYGIEVTENKKGQYRYFPDGKREGKKGCPGRRLGNDYEREDIERYYREREHGCEKERDYE